MVDLGSKLALAKGIPKIDEIITSNFILEEIIYLYYRLISLSWKFRNRSGQRNSCFARNETFENGYLAAVAKWYGWAKKFGFRYCLDEIYEKETDWDDWERLSPFDRSPFFLMPGSDPESDSYITVNPIKCLNGFELRMMLPKFEK